MSYERCTPALEMVPRHLGQRPIRFRRKRVDHFSAGISTTPRQRLVRGQSFSLVEQAPGLQFSLRPPKSVRHAFTAVKRAVTIKNVAKVAGVAAAVALAPVAAPLILTAARAAASRVIGFGKSVLRPTAPTVDMGGSTPTSPAPVDTSAPVPSAPTSTGGPQIANDVPGYSYSGGGGGGSMATGDTSTAPAPAQAGMGGGMIGLLVLGGLLLATRKGR